VKVAQERERENAEIGARRREDIALAASVTSCLIIRRFLRSDFCVYPSALPPRGIRKTPLPAGNFVDDTRTLRGDSALPPGATWKSRKAKRQKKIEPPILSQSGLKIS
jgi:hypothetical protein